MSSYKLQTSFFRSSVEFVKRKCRPKRLVDFVCSLCSTDPGQNTHRYHFSLTGYVKEIIFQNKAIVYFKLNGKEERAVLLAKMFAVNGKPLEEIIKPMQTLADFIKINEAIQFDCHVYDKVGPGSGKDKCNFFVMKACKYGDIWPTTMSTHTTLIPAPPSRSGTGWVSEVTELHGVLTYTYNGVDQRVCKSSK